MYDKSGYRHIPHAFFEFITFLTNALPLRSIPLFWNCWLGRCWPNMVLSPTPGWPFMPAATRPVTINGLSMANGLGLPLPAGWLSCLRFISLNNIGFWSLMTRCFFVHSKKLRAAISTTSMEPKKTNLDSSGDRTGFAWLRWSMVVPRRQYLYFQGWGVKLATAANLTPPKSWSEP